MNRALVNPALLRWSRESGGYASDDVARRLKVHRAMLDAWESGDAAPTVSQAQAMARLYKRPLAAFYLPSPPHEPEAPLDFRLTEPHRGVRMGPALRVALRQARRRQSLAIQLAEATGATVSSFPLHADQNLSPEGVAHNVRTALGARQMPHHEWATVGDAFRGWRSAVEAVTGTLVFVMREVTVDECRGFSIAEFPMPVVAVNGQDAYAGRVFTLLHELVHLLLRQGGICDPLASPDAAPSEVFCNAVAAAIIVPRDALENYPVLAGGGPVTDDQVARTATAFRTSREVVWRRLLTLGRISQQVYEEKRADLQGEQRARSRPGEQKGPSPAVLAISDLGRPFIRLVLDGYRQDIITGGDVADYLGVRLKYLPQIEASVWKEPK